jgi:hypothetical protein
MKRQTDTVSVLTLTVTAAALGWAGVAHATPAWSGWAIWPANTFSVGPTSGRFAGTGNGGNPLPLLNRQPVQGFSAVLNGPTSGSYVVMPDNGFATQGN